MSRCFGIISWFDKHDIFLSTIALYRFFHVSFQLYTTHIIYIVLDAATSEYKTFFQCINIGHISITQLLSVLKMPPTTWGHRTGYQHDFVTSQTSECAGKMFNFRCVREARGSAHIKAPLWWNLRVWQTCTTVICGVSLMGVLCEVGMTPLHSVH